MGLSSGIGWTTPDGELADRTLLEVLKTCRLAEQVAVAATECAGGQAHVGRHEVQGLEKNADVFEHE